MGDTTYLLILSLFVLNIATLHTHRTLHYHRLLHSESSYGTVLLSVWNTLTSDLDTLGYGLGLGLKYGLGLAFGFGLVLGDSLRLVLGLVPRFSLHLSLDYH